MAIYQLTVFNLLQLRMHRNRNKRIWMGAHCLHICMIVPFIHGKIMLHSPTGKIGQVVPFKGLPSVNVTCGGVKLQKSGIHLKKSTFMAPS